MNQQPAVLIDTRNAPNPPFPVAVIAELHDQLAAGTWKQPRLGAASIMVSFSDADGLLVEHGTAGSTLLHVNPEFVERDDWDLVWDALREVAARAVAREGARRNG